MARTNNFSQCSTLSFILFPFNCISCFFSIASWFVFLLHLLLHAILKSVSEISIDSSRELPCDCSSIEIMNSSSGNFSKKLSAIPKNKFNFKLSLCAIRFVFRKTPPSLLSHFRVEHNSCLPSIRNLTATRRNQENDFHFMLL